MTITWNDDAAFWAAGLQKSDNNLTILTKELENIGDLSSAAGQWFAKMNGLYVQGNTIFFSPPPWEEDFPLGTVTL